MIAERLVALRQKLEAIPRFRLAALPTPLEPAPNLSAQLGVTVLIKRDDLTGLGMGGNKARKLEYIVADARRENADFLLTSAAAQSNFCRMTVAAARRAGVGAGLLLRGAADTPVQGNLLIDYLLGAEIRFTPNPDPYASDTYERLLDWQEEARRSGRRPYLIYLHDGSRPAALATIGYVQGALELAGQLEAMGQEIDHVYVAVGSGGTLAGLLLGLRYLGVDARVVGVCVGALSDVVGPRTLEFASAAADLLGLPPLAQGDLVLDDDQRGPAYGVPTRAGLDAILRLARTEALIANPAYTGKALAALVADVERGLIRPGQTVLFLQTGGDPLVYVYAEVLAAHARATPLDHALRSA